MIVVEKESEMADPNPVSDVVEWIDHILKSKRWTGTDLARKANLAPSTILRMINDPQHRFMPSFRTLKKISEGSGYPIPEKIMFELKGPDAVAEDAKRPDDLPPRSPRTGRQMADASYSVPLRSVSALPEGLQASTLR